MRLIDPIIDKINWNAIIFCVLMLHFVGHASGQSSNHGRERGGYATAVPAGMPFDAGCRGSDRGTGSLRGGASHCEK